MDMATLDQRLTTIEEMLKELIGQKTIKDFYSVDEVAERVERSTYQVRDWLKTGRIRGIKRESGRGLHKEWAVSHAELVRYENHGLLSPSEKPPWG
jgi:transposase